MGEEFTPDQKRYLEGFVTGLGASRLAKAAGPAKAEPVGPDAIHFKAQAGVTAAGLFYVAPAQNSYMCRLRIPNGLLKHWQFAGLADVAEKFCGPYAHVTTRANLQLREIEPKNATNVIEAIQDLGLW
jgi:ferredoxin-nitrite reductase